MSQGTYLGGVSSTGVSTGPHLHFGLRTGNVSSFWSATAMNPLDYMDTDDKVSVTPTSPPTGAWIWSDKTVAAVGEEIAFNYNATGATDFVLGIDKVGVGRVQTVDIGTSDWYRTSFSEPGTYTIYAMCCNSAGHMDSNYITFTIVSPEKSRSVAGDFNGDGLDDYATLFDYGNGRIQWHVFLSTGSGFSEEIWRESLSDYGYYASCTSGRVAAGDFDGDGKDDVAVMYDYSTGSEIHVFLSTGSSFKSWQSWYSDRTSYKSSNSYIAAVSLNLYGGCACRL